MADANTTPEEPLDPRVAEWIKNNCEPNHYGEQDENGVDLSLIRAAKRLSPDALLARANRMILNVQEMKRWRERGRFSEQ